MDELTTVQRHQRANERDKVMLREAEARAAYRVYKRLRGVYLDAAQAYALKWGDDA